MLVCHQRFELLCAVLRDVILGFLAILPILHHIFWHHPQPQDRLAEEILDRLLLHRILLIRLRDRCRRARLVHADVVGDRRRARARVNEAAAEEHREPDGRERHKPPVGRSHDRSAHRSFIAPARLREHRLRLFHRFRVRQRRQVKFCLVFHARSFRWNPRATIRTTR